MSNSPRYTRTGPMAQLELEPVRTCAEIGKALGMTKGGVRKIEQRALWKLGRMPLAKALLREIVR